MLARCQRDASEHPQRIGVGAVQSGNDYKNDGAYGASSADLGATGGNIGNLDGSSSWRKIGAMKLRHGSQQWGRDGCWAMW